MHITAASLVSAACAASALAGEPTLPDTTHTLDLSRSVTFDASARSSLAPAGATSGHDGKGFFVSDGGANKLYIGGHYQFRYIDNWREDGVGNGDSGYTNGFTFRRMRLTVSGTVIDPRLSFGIQGDFNTGGTFQLVEVFGEYKLNDKWSLKWGEFKLQLLQEENTGHVRQQAVERSAMDTVFTQNYSQGVQLRYAGDPFRATAAFSDGINSLNTDFVSNVEYDFAFTGRGEWKLAGDWKQFEQFSSWRSASSAAFLGAAAHFQNGGSTAAPGGTPLQSTPNQSLLQYTADVSIKGSGWNVFASFVGRNIDVHSDGPTFDDFGFVVQGGLFLTDQFEVFARYDELFPDSDRGATGNDFAEITAGGNYYFVPESQVAKFTADLVWFPDDQAGSSSLMRPNTGIGLLASNKDNQFALRFQIQIIF